MITANLRRALEQVQRAKTHILLMDGSGPAVQALMEAEARLQQHFDDHIKITPGDNIIGIAFKLSVEEIKQSKMTPERFFSSTTRTLQNELLDYWRRNVDPK